MSGSSLANWDGSLSLEDRQQFRIGTRTDGMPFTDNPLNESVARRIQEEGNTIQRVFAGNHDEERVKEEDLGGFRVNDRDVITVSATQNSLGKPTPVTLFPSGDGRGPSPQQGGGSQDIRLRYPDVAFEEQNQLNVPTEESYYGGHLRVSDAGGEPSPSFAQVGDPSSSLDVTAVDAQNPQALEAQAIDLTQELPSSNSRVVIVPENSSATDALFTHNPDMDFHPLFDDEINDQPDNVHSNFYMDYQDNPWTDKASSYTKPRTESHYELIKKPEDDDRSTDTQDADGEGNNGSYLEGPPASPAPSDMWGIAEGQCSSYSSNTYEYLFTPPPPPPVRRKRVFSHVAVPPLPEGLNKTDYRRPPMPKPRPIASGGEVHANPVGALQTSTDQNQQLCVVPMVSLKTKDVLQNQSAVAGPSSVSSWYMSAAEGIKQRTSARDEDDDGDERRKKAKPKATTPHWDDSVHHGSKEVYVISDSEDEYQPKMKPQASSTNIQRKKAVLQKQDRPKRVSRSPRVQEKENEQPTAIEIAHVPRVEVGLVHLQLRFLRRRVTTRNDDDRPKRQRSSDEGCEPSEPCWRRWESSPVCKSLLGLEENLSPGGWLEPEAMFGSGEGGLLVQEERPPPRKEQRAVMNTSSISPNKRHRPSAKALGKRRAINPTTDNIPSAPPYTPASPEFSRDQHTTSPAISAQLHSSTYANLLVHTLPGSIHESTTHASNTFLTQSAYPSLGFTLPLPTPTDIINSFYGPPLEPDDFRTANEGPYAMLGQGLAPQDLTVNPTELWSGHSISSDPLPFGDGTIDPSLLLAEDPLLAQLSPLSSRSPSPQPLPDHSHASASAFLSSSESGESSAESPRSPRRAPLKEVIPSTTVPPSLSAPVGTRALRPQHWPRQPPEGMVSIDELDLSSSGSQDGDVPLSRSQVSKKKSQRPALAPDQGSDKTRGIIKYKKGKDWPRDPEPNYCHQCRSKSYVHKVYCGCDRRYCVRCLMSKYNGETVYDPATEASFVCPCCKGICTCDKCTTRRGEVYVRVRGAKPAETSEPPQRPVREKKAPTPTGDGSSSRKRLGGKTNLPPPTAAVPVVTYTGGLSFFGTMYGMDGAKIGSAFLGTSEDPQRQVVVMQSLQEGFVQPEALAIQTEKPRRKPKTRVFVGEIQPSWGLGEDVSITLLEPLSQNDKYNGPHERIYIGDKSALDKSYVTGLTHPDGWWHVGKEPEEEEMRYPLQESMSPLTSLEDEDDAAGTGESRQWPVGKESDNGIIAQGELDAFIQNGPQKGFCKDSLGEIDVLRAITMGLTACGVSVRIFNPTQT